MLKVLTPAVLLAALVVPATAMPLVQDAVSDGADGARSSRSTADAGLTPTGASTATAVRAASGAATSAGRHARQASTSVPTAAAAGQTEPTPPVTRDVRPAAGRPWSAP